MPTTPYGKGEFTNLADPKPLTDNTGQLSQAEPLLQGTPVSSGPNPVSDQKIPASMKKSAVTSDK